MSRNNLPEGTAALMEVLNLREIMALIERTARWVDPKTFALLPVWYPEHARQSALYNADWSAPQTNTNRKTGITQEKYEGNTHANKALTSALSLTSQGRRNWTCCHLWGVDDDRFQSANVVVQDHRYYSCVANMVLLPTPLKAFTDTVPEVKTMLRLCARNVYGWQCGHESMDGVNAALDDWRDWEVYPPSWPRNQGDPPPMGVMPIDDNIRNAAHRRWKRIREDIVCAGRYYPKQFVMDALAHWGLDPEKELAG